MASDVRSATDPIRILFVCLGNICRSPAAQAVMQAIVDENNAGARFSLDSAGLYAGHAGELPDPRMRAHARMRELTLDHRSRPVTESDFHDSDIILAMDDSNYDALRRLAPDIDSERKVQRMIDWCTSHPGHYSVPDPYYGGAEGFENVLDLLADACYNLYTRLSSGVTIPPSQN